MQIFSGMPFTWDTSRNFSTIIFRNAIGKVHEEVRKFVVSLRFEKIRKYLHLYKDYRGREENAGKPLRVDDYLEFAAIRMENHHISNEL